MSGGVTEGRLFAEELLLPCACLCRGSGPRQRVFAEGCSLPRVRPSAKTLCRASDYLPSAKGQALGKDALSGSEPDAVAIGQGPLVPVGATNQD